MFKKLMDGEIGLASTFWKFGVLGLPIITFLSRFFGKMLLHKLKGHTILSYYVSPNNPIETSTVVLTILYLASSFSMIFYSFSLLLGTWRSSAEYNRSLWFRHLARIFMVLMVYFALEFTFKFGEKI